MARAFTYQGKIVVVPYTADMPRSMRPDGKLASAVQRAIAATPTWEKGEDPIFTFHFPDVPILPMTVEVGTLPRVWGVHRGHQASDPGLSCFVDTKCVSRQLKGFVTVELAGTPQRPILTRAYGGQYSPPLPWMRSAKNAPDGREECLAYWQEHAYRSLRLGLITPGTHTTEPPSWFVAR